MPPVKTDPLTPGDRLECRVGQVWFWEGYFTRVGIDLISYYGAELIQVTDLVGVRRRGRCQPSCL